MYVNYESILTFKKKLSKAKLSGDKKITVMIDMDSVMVDPLYIEAMEKFLGHDIDLDDVNSFYVQDVVLGDRKKEFFANFDKVNLYDGAKIFDGCNEVLKKYSDRFEFYMCTDYIWKEAVWAAGANLMNKYNFMLESSVITPRNFIFTGDKSIVKTDIKIDDRTTNLVNAKLKVLYTAWHNKNMPDEKLDKEKLVRVSTWEDIDYLFDLIIS